MSWFPLWVGVSEADVASGAEGRLLSRSIKTSVPLPYARKRIESLSISAFDRPGSLLIAFRSCANCQRGLILLPCSATAHCVGDAVGEPDELDCILAVPPFRSQREYEVQGRVVRVGIVIV